MLTFIRERMGIGGHIDGPGDWKPDPNAAKNFREFIEKGGYKIRSMTTQSHGQKSSKFFGV